MVTWISFGISIGISTLAGLIVIFFHETGHYLTGLYYGLKPKLVRIKLGGFPAPGVRIESGVWPSRWHILLSGLLFSFGGFPFFLWIIQEVFNLKELLVIYFSISYFIMCFCAIGPGIKKSDYYYFKNFDKLK